MAYPVITFLYTEQYSASVNIYRIFLLTFFAQMFGRGTILRAFNETKSIFRANLTSMITGISLGYFLIKNFGLTGGATSAVIAYYVNAIMQIYKSKLVLNLKFSAWLPWKKMGRILLYSLMTTPIIFFMKYLELSKPVLIIISGIMYFSTLLFIYHKANLINIDLLKEKILCKKSHV